MIEALEHKPKRGRDYGWSALRALRKESDGSVIRGNARKVFEDESTPFSEFQRLMRTFHSCVGHQSLASPSSLRNPLEDFRIDLSQFG